MEMVNNSHEQMRIFSTEVESPRKSQMKTSRKKNNPQQNKNKQKHVISKMKTSFKGLTSKLDIVEQKIGKLITAALFRSVKTWKQPKFRFRDKWIKKMKHIYTMEYYSLIKRLNNVRDHHIKEIKSDKEKQISYDIAYIWNLKKMISMNLFTKQK